MDLLATIREIGLPEWLVIWASIAVILKMIGVLDPIISFFGGLFGMVRERVEASVVTERTEQIAIWKQSTDLISQMVDRDDRLIEYIIADSKIALDDIKDEQKSQKYHVKAIENKMTMLISIISELYDKRRADDDKDTRTIENIH